MLYAGSIGAGKSMVLLLDVLNWVQFPDFQGLILRRSNPSLKELKVLSYRYYPRTGAEFNKTENTWTWPSGAQLEMAFLDSDEDRFRYEGRSLHWIGFDELQLWANEEVYLWLHTRIRSSNPNIPCFVRASANPLGPGNQWIRKRFIQPAPAGTPIWDPLTKQFRVTIKALPRDNPHLPDEYFDRLNGLPEHQRKAYLEGSWDVYEGQMFDAWNPGLHVCKPFRIPESWIKFRSGDYGHVRPSCILWWAQDPDGNLVCYRELWQAGLDADQLAEKIRKIESTAHVLIPGGEEGITGPLDPQCWERGGHGFTVADRMARRGVRWFKALKGPGSRIQGAHELHRRLKGKTTDRDGSVIPSIRFFDTCTETIRTIPALIPDKKNPEDVEEGGDDHGYDAVRYALRYRPFSTRLRDPGSRGGSGGKSFDQRWRSRSQVTGY